MTLTQYLNQPDTEDYSIQHKEWGIIYNDNNDAVTLDVWFEGDKRYGVTEIYWKCENPPSDIADYIFDFIWEHTGLSRHFFEGAQLIRTF